MDSFEDLNHARGQVSGPRNVLNPIESPLKDRFDDLNPKQKLGMGT